MPGYETYLEQDARLVILKELAKQNDGRLNESLLNVALDVFGHRRSRDWVRTQMRKLEDIGALAITEAGESLIATITRAGVDHVERRAFLDGVAKPSLGG